MKIFRYMFMFLLLMCLSITASNQESRHLETINEGLFIVKAVYVDSEGVKWFGTNRGLCRYHNLSWRYYTEADHLLGDQVNALAFEQTESGRELWVATTEGVSVLAFDTDGVTGSTTYTTDAGLLNNDVTDIAVDSRHGKFFGSADGITWFHDGSMDSILFTENYSSMYATPVRQMDVYGDTLYVAQDGGIGRFVSDVDAITGASRWGDEPSYGVSPFTRNIRSVMVKGEEMQYFGTDMGIETHSGYYAKDNWGLLSTDNGLVHNEVIAIAEDPEGGLWFGTLGGVSNLADGVWTSYTSADGLLSDTVYGIDFDLDGSVWFATGAGACQLKDGVFQDFVTAVPQQIVSGKQFHLFFNDVAESINLSYVLTQSVRVYARLYNSSGILMAAWDDLPSVSGHHRVELPLSIQSLSSPQQGIYILQLMQGKTSLSRKFLIAR